MLATGIAMLKNFIAMPWLLRLLTMGGLFVVGWTAASMLPDRAIDVAGQPVSTSEWWASGAGPLALFVGLMMGVGAILMLKRSRYGRPTYVSAWLAMSISIPFVVHLSGGDPTRSMTALISNVVITALIAVYLYGRRAVRDYFRR